MVYKKRSNPRYAKKRVYRRKTATASKRKPTFAKRVKTVISHMAENKSQFHTANMPLVPYSASDWALSVTPITPYQFYTTILQGSGAGQRVGNSIHIKSLKLTGVLRALPYNATTNTDPVPMYVKLLFLTKKDTPTELFPSLADVLQFGNDSSGPGSTAELQRMQRPINKDNWIYHTSRVFKLGYANYAGTSADINAQTFANNDFKLNHFVNIDLTKYCTKNIKFDDNTSIPSSRNIVMYPLLYTANGSTIINQTPASFNYSIDIVYEDM